MLATLGEAAGLVNVRHGGRRINLVGDSSFEREFRYNATTRTWDAASPYQLPDTLHGGTFASALFASHDVDSAVRVRPSTSGNQQTFALEIFNVYAPAWRPLTSLIVPTTSPGGSECIRQEKRDTVINGQPTVTDYLCTLNLATGTWTDSWARPAFSPLGDRVLLAINQQTHTSAADPAWLACPLTDSIQGQPRSLCRGYSQDVQSSGGALWEIRFANPVPVQVSQYSATSMFWLGLSEDGGELVVGEGNNETHVQVVVESTGFNTSGSYGRLSGCQVAYRHPVTLALINAEPSQDACEPFEAGGTIAPAPRNLASGGGS